MIISAASVWAYERPLAESLAGDWDFVAVESMLDIVTDRSAKPDFPQLSPRWHLLIRLPERLDEYPEKPYIIGESILFNTWPGVDSLLSAIKVCAEMMAPVIAGRNNTPLDDGHWPWWYPSCMDDCLRVSLALRARTTVNMISDMPLIRAGLIDDPGNPRWSKADWTWHNDDTASPYTTQELQEIGSAVDCERPAPCEVLRHDAPALSSWTEPEETGLDRTAAMYYLADGCFNVKPLLAGWKNLYRVDAGLHGSFTVHVETVWLNQTVTDLTEYIIPGQKSPIVLQVVDIVGQGGVYKPLYLAVE